MRFTQRLRALSQGWKKRAIWTAGGRDCLNGPVPEATRKMTAAQMATALKREVAIIRRDGRELLANLRARNRAHAITRAWTYQILAAGQVIEWLR